ncbi:MAG TPA: dTMP kinase [Thermoplasmata archaeon]|nr:dTMP kinase [Thermoplasmata archaeon]HEV2428794.1 dTMP kinase [Thermoplasmata archaeon]
MTERGTYVVIEGIDGSGKTELASRLVPVLIGRGHSVSSFREPADRFLRAEAERLSRSDPMAAAMCFTVDRAMQRNAIELALDHGDVVLQDRSFYSTLAYQYPGLSEDRWRELERIERAVVIDPDVVLYLDVPIDVAMRRLEGRGPRDSFEDEPYLTKVRRKFEQMFQPPRWVRIDAHGPPERTLESAVNALLASSL